MIKLHTQLGLTDLEYNEIKKRLGREPNELETYLFSAMWSEHCGYSHSKKYLSKFPKEGSLYPEENAGGIRIGDTAVFFKVESHNHPSAVEPFQGAATGIGGIIRDILALGARPIALLDSLKFGKLDNNRTKYLLNGVIKGISAYGNSIGVPTVGGEIGFDECYQSSPLVNVMAVGIAKIDEIKLSAAPPNQHVVIVGSYTGRDGIHGASFASKELSENSNEDKPSVQIGDPFIKKILIEATLEILKSKEVLACQDCGAAGLLSSTSEMAFKGNCGMELYLEQVHLREKQMKPWEIMLSESQERMIFVATEAGVKEILEIAKKYEIPAREIGKTIKEKEYRLFWQNEEVANVSPEILNTPALYDLCENEPEYIKKLGSRLGFLPQQPKNINIEEYVENLVLDPNFASKNWVYSQYDYTVGNRTCITPEKSGVAGIWLKEENCIIGLTMDSNGRQVFLNPYQGSKNTVYESFRNLVSSGFKPLGVTNCLNFGNPEKDEVGYQFVKSVEGIADACKELSIPVVSGNVSFYNECEQIRVYPTPTIGMIGVAGLNDTISAKFNPNESIYMIGEQIDEINVEIDIELEKKLAETIFKLRDKKILKGALDVSYGGIIGALLEGLFNANSGFKSIQNSAGILFRQHEIGCYVISTDNENELEKICKTNNIPYQKLGKTNNTDKIRMDGCEFSLKKLKNSYMNSIADIMGI